MKFGRQAYVGLSDQRFGTVRLGRQYDSVVDYLQAAIFPWGGFFVHGGDIVNTANSFRVNKYLLLRGVYIAPRGFIVLSLPLTDEDISNFIATVDDFIQAYGHLLPGS